MADFCKACAIDNFGDDTGDLKGLCNPGFFVQVICEGCGYIYVDHEGVCQMKGCLENHNPKAPECS